MAIVDTKKQTRKNQKLEKIQKTQKQFLAITVQCSEKLEEHRRQKANQSSKIIVSKWDGHKDQFCAEGGPKIESAWQLQFKLQKKNQRTGNTCEFSSFVRHWKTSKMIDFNQRKQWFRGKKINFAKLSSKAQEWNSHIISHKCLTKFHAARSHPPPRQKAKSTQRFLEPPGNPRKSLGNPWEIKSSSNKTFGLGFRNSGKREEMWGLSGSCCGSNSFANWRTMKTRKGQCEKQRSRAHTKFFSWARTFLNNIFDNTSLSGQLSLSVCPGWKLPIVWCSAIEPCNCWAFVRDHTSSLLQFIRSNHGNILLFAGARDSTTLAFVSGVIGHTENWLLIGNTTGWVTRKCHFF